MKKSNVVGLVVLSSLLVLTQSIAYQRYLIRKNNEERNIASELQSVKERMASALSSCTSSVKTLGFIVSEYGVPEQFDSVARNILQSGEYIDALQLTRNGVITHNYPHGVSDAAIGFDILSDSATRREAKRAIESREIFFAGPMELKQGGKGVAGRLPIFKGNQFQGFAIALIRLSTLLKAIGIDTAQHAEFNYQLSKINPATHQQEYFLPQTFEADKGKYASIDIPAGAWKIMIKAKHQHGLFSDITLSIMGLFLSVTGGVFAWHLAGQPEKLTELVATNLALVRDSQNQSRNERLENDRLIALNEARLIEAQAVANVGSWETDLTTLKVIWSPQIYKIFELDPVAFHPTHNTFLDFVYARDRDKVERAFAESFICEDKCFLEHRITTGSGVVKWVEEQWRVYCDEQGVPYRAVGTCQDITKRKLAEVEKAMLIDNTEESFILLDNNLSIVSFNRQFHVLYEKYFDLIVEKNRSILDYARPERIQDLRNVYASVLAGNTEESEFKFVLADGTEKIFSIKYKPVWNEINEIIGVFVTNRDITKRRLAEIQIQDEKFFSDSLVNSLPGIFYLYDEMGVFVRWNKNLEEVSGYRAEEIRHMEPLDFFDHDEKYLVQQVIDTVFTQSKSDVTAHLLTKHKGKIPYYFNGHKVNLNGKNYLIGVGIDITQRVHAEKELLVYTEDIKRLTAHLEQVREDERTRIAREVHDELGQQLTGLKMDASWLSKKIRKEQFLVHEKLSKMNSLMDHAIRTIRRIASDLRPGILDDLGLVAALEWQSAEFEKQYEIRCDFKSEVGDVQMERQFATTVFRIYQEALTNVVRHARATHVQSILQRTNDWLILTVHDNGQGFDEKETRSRGTLGLMGMRERALMVGAELNIDTSKSAGTIIRLKIPLSSIPNSIS